MNFPKLQALMEAKNRPAADEMDFDLDAAGEGEVEEKAEKKEAPAVDKAAVLAFLKGCDAKCRAQVKAKLDKMVAADAAEEK